MSRLIIVSNRLPVTITLDASSDPEITRSSGGLVAALGPIHDASDSLWVGNLGDEPSAETGRALETSRFVDVPVSAEEYLAYYEGYSNSSLWPIFHYLPERAHFNASDFEVYRQINKRFANTIADLAEPGDIIWVQDYQLLLVPGLLRERLPDARIGFFSCIRHSRPRKYSACCPNGRKSSGAFWGPM